MEGLSTGGKFQLRSQIDSHVKNRSKEHSRLLQSPQAGPTLVCSRNSTMAQVAVLGWLGKRMVRSEITEESNKWIISFVKEGKKFSFGAIKHLFTMQNKVPGEKE